MKQCKIKHIQTKQKAFIHKLIIKYLLTFIHVPGIMPNI